MCKQVLYHRLLRFLPISSQVTNSWIWKYFSIFFVCCFGFQHFLPLRKRFNAVEFFSVYIWHKFLDSTKGSFLLWACSQSNRRLKNNKTVFYLTYLQWQLEAFFTGGRSTNVEKFIFLCISKWYNLASGLSAGLFLPLLHPIACF